MQLTANGAHMVVDFYPVKYADGSISERLMYKTVTFCDKMQSKSYINKESFEKEVESRVEGYNYEVTDMHTEPQLFNSALIQTRWWFMSLIKTYLHNLMKSNNPYVNNLIEMGYDRADCEMVAAAGLEKTFPCVIHGRTFESQDQYDEELAEYLNGL